MVRLTNEGNSCYFNSALACLLYTPYIANNFKHFSEENPLGKELKNIFHELFNSDYNYKTLIHTKKIFKAFKQQFKSFDNYNQNDAHDAFMSLTEIIPSLLEQVYQGKIQNKVQCLKCKNESSNIENFNSLFLKDTGNISDNLNEFFAHELFENYRCDACDSYSSADRFSSIQLFPKVLILKSRAKNPTLTLEINNHQYELYAVIQYKGNSRRGHYTSMVKTQNIWYHIDDDCCVFMNDPITILKGCCLLYKTTG